MTPSSPDCMDIHPFGNVHNELDIGVVVVVGSSGYLNVLLASAMVLLSQCVRFLAYLNILIRHSDVVSVGG